VQDVTELPFVAGHVALDFVNTAEGRGHAGAGEALAGPADLLVWGRRRGLLADAATAGEDDQGELERAIESRELLYALFLAAASGRPASRPQLSRLTQLAAIAFEAGSIRPAGDASLEWSWSPSRLASVRHVAVTSAVDLLRQVPAGRLKQCPGEHCGWFFLDATKRGNRRWCSMSECGQDAKDERRRARRQAASR
jgi:predicted RNA-binding Zn ribbon-like protein